MTMSDSTSDIREYVNEATGDTFGAYAGSAPEEALQSNPDWTPVDGGTAEPVSPDTPESEPETETPEVTEEPETAEPVDLEPLDRHELDSLAGAEGIEDPEQLP